MPLKKHRPKARRGLIAIFNPDKLLTPEQFKDKFNNPNFQRDPSIITTHTDLTRGMCRTKDGHRGISTGDGGCSSLDVMRKPHLIGGEGKGLAPEFNPHHVAIHRDVAPQSAGVGLHPLEFNPKRKTHHHTSKPHLEAFPHLIPFRPRLLDSLPLGFGNNVSAPEKVTVVEEKKLHARGEENKVVA